MKLTLVVFLVIAMAMTITAASAATTTFAGSLPAGGYNLMSIPGIPLDPDPEVIFGGADIEGKLWRWNAPTQGLVVYSMWNPNVPMLLTDGYWVLVGNNDLSFSFEGLNDNDNMDIWISLPKAGWTLIGHPYSYSLDWDNDNVKVTDGNTTKTLRDAAAAGWLDTRGFGYDNMTKGMRTLDVWDEFPQMWELNAWGAYWIRSHVDKLALILEASPPVQ